MKSNPCGCLMKINFKTLKLNRRCLEFILTQRLRSQLIPLLWHRIIEVTLHISAVALLLIFIIKNLSAPLYVTSAGMLLFLPIQW